MIASFVDPWELAWTQLWQTTAVIVLTAIVVRLCCRNRPHLAYLLWLLVFVKCWIPPVWSSPSGIFCWLTAEAPPAARAAVESETLAAVAVVAKDQTPQTGLPQADPPPSPSLPLESANLAVSPEPLWPLAIVTVWALGAALLITMTISRLAAWRRRVFSGVQAPDPALDALVGDLAARLGLRRRVRVVISSAAIGPAAFGVVRPTVALPAALVEGEARRDLAAIVTHELAHVRRGDLLWGWLQLATEIAWWFHPLVWWASRQLSRERERCCDEETVALLQCDPAAYAQTLINVMKLRSQPRLIAACPGIRAVQVTARRLEHIVRCGANAHRRTPRGYWLAVMAAFCLLAPGASWQAAGFAAPKTQDQPEQVVAAQADPRDDGKEPTPDSKQNVAEDGEQDGQSPAPENAAANRSEPVNRAIAFLKSKQRQDGSWPDPVGYPGGITALCTLAMLRCGVTADDPAVARSLAYLRTLEPSMTYCTALVTLVFCEADLDQDRRLIKRNASWFAANQKQAGVMRGAWAYPQADGDNSNTGFAVMAMYGADRAGVHVDDQVWRSVLDYWIKAQNPNGSWGYKPGLPGTGSMTSEGAFSLAAAHKVLDDPNQEKAVRKALASAQVWLSRGFSTTDNPGSRGHQGWRLYYLFVLSEAARINHIDAFGGHDWRREGAESLLRDQQPDGSWAGVGHAENEPHVATSLALLFLRGGSARNEPDAK